MNILLCGANGFIGSYLAAHLLNAGHSLTLISRHFDYIKKARDSKKPLPEAYYRLGSGGSV